MTIGKILHSLSATKETGFEGLISKLLERLTGIRFFLSKSGSQQGQDAASLSMVSFECKRYDKTKFDERELLGEIAQICLSNCTPDVWVLAATRDIPAQLITTLQAFANHKAFDVVPLESLNDNDGSLDHLCAEYMDCTLAHCRSANIAEHELKVLEELLEGVKATSNHFGKVTALRNLILQPTLGYPIFRSLTNKAFKHSLASESESRRHYGQLLNLTDSNFVERTKPNDVLNTWWQNNYGRNEILAVLGEEGDGKTWTIAHWLEKSCDQTNFPAVVFIASRSVQHSACLSELILARVRELTRTNRSLEQKFERWIKSRLDFDEAPLAVVIFDGLNERNTGEFWREILECSQSSEFNKAFSFILTTRTSHWKPNFEGLEYPKFRKLEILSFDDQELSSALKRHNLELANFHEDAHVLLRKPRYFDLATKHYSDLIKSGDITKARLIYLDWKDRYNRKNMTTLTNEEFQNLLMSLAGKIKSTRQFERSEVIDSLAGHSNPTLVLQDLTSSGIFDHSSGKLRIAEDRLTLGLSLLLCAEIAEKAETDPSEIISSWIEPYTSMDIQAHILEHAVVHVFSGPTNFTNETCVAILHAWLNCQNQSSTSDKATNQFTAYILSKPAVYFSLAEKLWTVGENHPWGQEALLFGFIRWRNELCEVLPKQLERWLGFVALHGIPPLRSQEALQSEFLQRLDFVAGGLSVGGTKTISKLTITGMADDGWIRLARAALAIISAESDVTLYLRALCSGILVETIYNYPEKRQLFEWIFRSKHFDMTSLNEILSELNNTEIELQAAHAISLYADFDTAVRAEKLKVMKADVLSVPQRVESGYALAKSDLLSYLTFPNANPSVFIERDAQRFCWHSDFIDDESIARLSTVLDGLETYDLFWCGGYGVFEKGEGVICRYFPERYGNLVRHYVNNPYEMYINEWALKLHKYELLLTLSERPAIEKYWRKLEVERKTAPRRNTDLAEAYSFRLALSYATGNTQLKLLNARSDSALDLENIRHCFQWEGDAPLQLDSCMQNGRRLLWYLVTTKQYQLSWESLKDYLLSNEQVEREYGCRYLYEQKDRNTIATWIRELDWKWSPLNHVGENDLGSRLLIEFGDSLPLDELLERISPFRRGDLLAKRDVQFEQWKNYASWITEQINMMIASGMESTLPSLIIDYVDSGSIEAEFSIAINQVSANGFHYVNPMYTWGGLQFQSTAESFRRAFSPQEELDKERTELQKNTYKRVDELGKNGHYWLRHQFPITGLSFVIKNCPELVHGWLNQLKTNSRSELLFSARPFYEGLCEALFQENSSDWNAEAGRLYEVLTQTKTILNIVVPEFELSRLDIALFRANATPVVADLWTKKLNSCKTDFELFEYVLLARVANHQDCKNWLLKRIASDQQSDFKFNVARAYMVSGFFVEKEESPATDAPIQSWLERIRSEASERGYEEHQARYWFERFCTERSNDESWSCYQLFRKCADRRIWLWLDERLNGSDVSERRKRFLKLNRYDLKSACRQNESRLKQQFLGTKVTGDLCPWLKSSLILD